MGANTGEFSLIAAKKGMRTIAFDSDPAAVEKLYLDCRESKGYDILPQNTDLTNPSPAIGWANNERMSFSDRGPTDCILALALIHHLAISNNVPFGALAEFFANHCKYLIIEFIPKEDSQIQKLLRNRRDIFSDYSQKKFETEFKKFFNVIETKRITQSQRLLFLMVRRQR